MYRSACTHFSGMKKVTIEGGGMRISKIAALLVLMALSPASVFAAINATASYTSQQLDATHWRYSMTLNNTGTTNISTYWFGWVIFPPIYDLLPSIPTNVQSPAGWNGAGLNDSIYGGYSAEWTTTTSPLAAGSSLSGFTFDSTDSPTVMSNLSPVFGAYRSDVSWVYIGPSQGDPGLRIQPTQLVPEPTIGLLLPATIFIARRKRSQLRIT
jgi:hypothetical protein